MTAFRGIEITKVVPSDKFVFPLDFLFLDFDTSKRIELESLDSEGKTRKLLIDVPNKIENPKEFQSLLEQYTSINEITISGEIKIIRLISKEEDEKISYLAFTPKGLQLIPFPPIITTAPTIFLSSAISFLYRNCRAFSSKLVNIKRENKVIEILELLFSLNLYHY